MKSRWTARRVVRSLDVVVPAMLLGLLVLCLLSPAIVATPPPTGGSVLEANVPPLSPGHLLGTDVNGDDMWSRVIHGGRTSILIALAVNLIGLCVGGALGATSALAGGVADTLIMRSLDALLAFPSLILVLAIAQTLEPSMMNMVCALAFFSVPAFARVARAATLRVRTLPFVTAAHLSGTRPLQILSRHVAPNIAPQLLCFALLGMSTVIIIEGAVGFLGFGVPAPQPTWGNMIQQGQLTLSATPRLVLLPSAFLFLTVLSFNLLGDALRVRWVSR